MDRRTNEDGGISFVMIPSLDFETYSEAGYCLDPSGNGYTTLMQNKSSISIVGAAAYAEHESTEILCFAYDIGSGRKLWYPGDPPPIELHQFIIFGGVLSAFNSFFEYSIWKNICRDRMNWPPLPIEQLTCTQARAYA
jgi:hypothetical protein